ncbi:MAG: glycosyltransferase family 4 protein [bacterium]
MKIAIIGQKGIPASYGGVERHVEELAVRLAKQGHEVFVYCRKHYVQPVRKTYKGVKLIFTPTIPTKNLDAITHTLFSTLDVLRRKVDIVHYHAVGPATMSIIPKLLKRKAMVVNTFHCRDQFHQKWGPLAKMYLRFGEYATAKFGHHTIAVSKDIANHCAETFNTVATYIPNGVTTENEPIDPETLKRNNLKKNGYFLTVARLVRHKNIHLLIKAYKKIKTDKKLVIVGDSSHTSEYVKELHELAAGNDNITFTGWQDKEELRALYKNCYLYIHPSQAEGLPIVVLEALAEGAEVLLSDVHEHKISFEKQAHYFKNNSQSSLIRSLKKLKGLEKNLAIKRANQKFVKELFNWDDIARDTANTYYGLIQAKKVRKKQAALKQI